MTGVVLMKRLLRQWSGVYRPALSELLRGKQDRAAAHSAGKADAERRGRELQRPATRRVSERALVAHAGRWSREDRSLANGEQPRPSVRQSRVPNTRAICSAQSRCWSMECWCAESDLKRGPCSTPHSRFTHSIGLVQNTELVIMASSPNGEGKL